MKTENCQLRAPAPKQMRPRFLVAAMLLALSLSAFTGCSTYRGELRPDPANQKGYIVPLPAHGATVKVAAPPGWHLDPDGRPCYLGSFTHPRYFLSYLTVTAELEPLGHGAAWRAATPSTPQGDLYRSIRAESRRTEPERLEAHRRFRSGLIPTPPSPLLHDPETWARVSTATTADGRRVWISHYSSPASIHQLVAYVPEAGYVVTIALSLEGEKYSAEQLQAITAVVTSYRCEKAARRGGRGE